MCDMTLPNIDDIRIWIIFEAVVAGFDIREAIVQFAAGNMIAGVFFTVMFIVLVALAAFSIKLATTIDMEDI